jgi:O-antigen/teichoic acid export membrane protein
MVYFDRFFLAMLVPSAQLAYYTTPFEIVNRLLILPSSITRALFPVLASQRNPQEAERAYKRSFWVIAWASILIATAGIAFGYFALKLWLGEEFAQHSYPIFAILLLGFATNSAAWAPFSLIQAFHRPDLSAKAHLLELPFYCVTLYFLAKGYGLIGASIAWTLRNSIDLIIMQFIAIKLKRSKWISSDSSSNAGLET